MWGKKKTPHRISYNKIILIRSERAICMHEQIYKLRPLKYTLKPWHLDESQTIVYKNILPLSNHFFFFNAHWYYHLFLNLKPLTVWQLIIYLRLCPGLVSTPTHKHKIFGLSPFHWIMDNKSCNIYHCLVKTRYLNISHSEDNCLQIIPGKSF